MKQALLIFAKEPVPGLVKTRLQTVLSADDCAALYARFIEDTARTATQVAQGGAGVSVIWFVAPGTVPGAASAESPGAASAESPGAASAESPGAASAESPGAASAESPGAASAESPRPRFQGWSDLPGMILPQKGAGLGERLAQAFESVRGMGFERAVVIGTDSPTLPFEYIESAFGALETADAVIGPSEDGGYYLLGLGNVETGFFKSVAYSQPDVAQRTRELLDAAGLVVETGPIWWDVDTPADLERLRRESSPTCAPASHGYLAQMEVAL